jgi:hypothetical protein
MTTPRPHHPHAAATGMLAALAGIALLVPLTLGGCNIVAPAAYAIHGPPKVPAAYDGLDANRPTTIFIDDRQNKIPKRSLRLTMGQVAERVMMDRGIVKPASMISSRDAARLASSKDSFNNPVSVVDLGRELGAEVVIWVEIHEWTLSRDGGSLSPTVGAMVKIVDAKENKRIWPVDPAGWPLMVQVPSRPQELGSNRAQIERYHEELAAVAGRDLARMFFSYERDSLQSRRTN